MRTIPLNGKVAAGRTARIDDEDYELVSQYSWNVREVVRPGFRGRGPYASTARRLDGKHTTILMHCLIMGAKGIDHINGDGLDNQRHNLRPATQAQNMANSRIGENSKSGFKGVWQKNARWRAKIKIDGRSQFLGSYTTAEAAARAYDAAALAAWGEFACLNFP